MPIMPPCVSTDTKNCSSWNSRIVSVAIIAVCIGIFSTAACFWLNYRNTVKMPTREIFIECLEGQFTEMEINNISLILDNNSYDWDVGVSTSSISEFSYWTIDIHKDEYMTLKLQYHYTDGHWELIDFSWPNRMLGGAAIYG